MTSITLHLWRESAPLSPFLRVWMGLTDYRQRAKNTTDYRQKEKKLPTTDIIDICFQKEEYFVFFGSNQIKFWLISWSNGKNSRFVDTSTCTLLQPISKSQKSDIENTTHLYILLKRQRWKTEHFLFRWTSQVFTQIHHKTRVLNEFAERIKISTKTIVPFPNLREMLSLRLLDRAFIDFA